MPIGTVTKSLSRAYALLRECLQKENHTGKQRGEIMNCSECSDDFAAYQEGLLDARRKPDQVALGRLPGLPGRIRPGAASCGPSDVHGPGASGISLENRVMDRIIHEQALTHKETSDAKDGSESWE